MKDLFSEEMKDLFSVDESRKGRLRIPAFDHKEPEDDDCGLPQHPIYANYTKYLWKSHTRSGGIQPDKRVGKTAVVKISL